MIDVVIGTSLKRTIESRSSWNGRKMMKMVKIMKMMSSFIGTWTIMISWPF